MGHHQPPIPFVTDSTTGDRFLNNKVLKRRPKSTEMRFYLVRNRVRQGNYLVYWARGKENSENYFTKYHPTKRNCDISSMYLFLMSEYFNHSYHQVPSSLLCHVTPTPRAWEIDNIQTRSPPPNNVQMLIRISDIITKLYLDKNRFTQNSARLKTLLSGWLKWNITQITCASLYIWTPRIQSTQK